MYKVAHRQSKVNSLFIWHHQHALLWDIDVAPALQTIVHDMRSFGKSFTAVIGGKGGGEGTTLSQRKRINVSIKKA